MNIKIKTVTTGRLSQRHYKVLSITGLPKESYKYPNHTQDIELRLSDFQYNLLTKSARKSLFETICMAVNNHVPDT